VLPTDSTPTSAALARQGGRRAHSHDRVLLAVSLAAVALPFLLVRFPPIADLPQQVAQLQLLASTWRDPSSPYVVDGLGPNRLVYVLLAGGWAVAGPRHAGQLAMVAIGALWALAAHGLARRRGRSMAAAVIASALFFNHATYWGFYAFALGAPLFAVWVHLGDRLPARLSWRGGAALLCGAILLFLAHALWFAAGMAWLASAALARHGVRAALARAAAVAPAVVVAALWWGSLGGTAFDATRIPPVWETGLLDRVRPAWLAQAALGGLRGRTEAVALGVLAIWFIAGGARALSLPCARDPPRLAAAPESRVDGALLLAAVLLFLAALVLPSKTASTILFAQRWMPPALFLAVLALPAPALPRRAAAALASAGVLAFAGLTGAEWRTFERVELAGLEESLEAIGPSERVLGLDLVKTSPTVRGRPFLQTFAWAQVLHGSPLAFSFAVFPSSLVRNPKAAPPPWTPNLEWYAERVRREDLGWFDVVLVNAADDPAHARLAASLALTPVTQSGRFRLYRTPPPPPTPPWSPTFLARHSMCAP
jgi:hypothetical protein